MRLIATLVLVAAALPAIAHDALRPTQPWGGQPPAPPSWNQQGLPPWAVPTPTPPPWTAQPIPPNPVFQNDPSLRDRDLMQEELELRRRYQQRWERTTPQSHEQWNRDQGRDQGQPGRGRRQW